MAVVDITLPENIKKTSSGRQVAHASLVVDVFVAAMRLGVAHLKAGSAGMKEDVYSLAGACGMEAVKHHELDWATLMARAQDGDAAAYLYLLEEITPCLRSHIARFQHDQRDIENIVQDILLTVHAVRQTYDPSRPFEPWLIEVANRRAFNRLRRQARGCAGEGPLAGENKTAAAGAAARGRWLPCLPGWAHRSRREE